MLASNCPSASILRGCSTRINLSSAGAKFNAPPQTMHAPIFSTILFNSGILFLTLHNTSIVSAVPAGLVMLLDDVFGTYTPAAASIGTTTIVVLLPGTPPIQCLSNTGELSICSTCPFATIALVKETVSVIVKPWI